MLAVFIVALIVGFAMGIWYQNQVSVSEDCPESQNGSEDSYSYDELEDAYRQGVQHGVSMQGYRYIETFDGTPGLVNGKGGVEFYICDGFLVNVVTGEEVNPLERVAVGTSGRRVVDPNTGEYVYVS